MKAKNFKRTIKKFNPYHDSKGRFTTSGNAASFTYAPGKSVAHDKAIVREKKRTQEEEKKKVKIVDHGFSDKQKATLAGIENKIVKLKREQLHVVDENGNAVMKIQGNKGSVSFKTYQAAAMKGKIVTHNHPRDSDAMNGGTFSTADVNIFTNYNIQTIRAVAKEGVYTLSKTDKSNKYDSVRFGAEYERFDKQEAAKLSKIRSEGRQKFQNRQVSHSDHVKFINQSFNDYLESGNKWLIDNAEKYGYNYSFEGSVKKMFNTIMKIKEIKDSSTSEKGEIVLDADRSKLYEELQKEIKELER